MCRKPYVAGHARFGDELVKVHIRLSSGFLDAVLDDTHALNQLVDELHLRHVNKSRLQMLGILSGDINPEYMSRVEKHPSVEWVQADSVRSAI